MKQPLVFPASEQDDVELQQLIEFYNETLGFCPNSVKTMFHRPQILSENVVDDVSTPHINETLLYDIVMSEGAKAYLTRNVNVYNEAQLFKPYKDLSKMIAGLIHQCNPNYLFAESLATSILEMSHSLNFYNKNLPSLTGFSINNNVYKILLKYI